MLIVILAIDVIVLTTWQVIDPMFRDTENFDLEPSPSTDQDIMLQPYLEHCNSKNISVWLGMCLHIFDIFEKFSIGLFVRFDYCLHEIRFKYILWQFRISKQYVCSKTNLYGNLILIVKSHLLYSCFHWEITFKTTYKC